MTADIDALLLQYGDGVYTVVVWAPLGGRQVPISRYSIFHGITPPETHTAVPSPHQHACADQYTHAGQYIHAGADQHTNPAQYTNPGQHACAGHG